MGTYIYTGLHPRKGVVPVHTFFPTTGGKPVVAMKSSIIIEGKSLQGIKLKDVKSSMDAYELFLISFIHETTQEYDYALLVENLDNDFIPEKVLDSILKSGKNKSPDSFIGIVVDHNPLDGTYTVGCGPHILINVTSDLTCMNPASELPSVQVQRSCESCDGLHYICDGQAEIKKLIDPAVTITTRELLSPRHSTKLKEGCVTPSQPAMPQAQSKPTKSTKLKASQTSESSGTKKLPQPQIQKNPTQGKKIKSLSSSSSTPSLKFSQQEAQNNASSSKPFKPFTGKCNSLRSESPIPAIQSRIKSHGGSGSSLSHMSSEEESWEIPDSAEPFGKHATTPFIECLREQAQRSNTKSSNLKPLTSCASSSSHMTLYPPAKISSTMSNSLSLPTNSASSTRSSILSLPKISASSTRSNILSLPKISASSTRSNILSLPSNSATYSSSSMNYKSLNTQAESNSTKNSQPKLLTNSATALSYESFEDSWGTPDPMERLGDICNIILGNPHESATNNSSWPRTKTNSTNSSSLEPLSAARMLIKKSDPQVKNNCTNTSQLTPSTSSAHSLFLEPLYPRTENGDHNPFTYSLGSRSSEPFTSRAQSSQLNPFNSSASSWSLTSTSTTSSLRYESLQPQPPHNHMFNHTRPSAVPATEYNPASDPTAGACSLPMDLDFEALKPTLSSLEKGNKMIEEIKTVTI